MDIPYEKLISTLESMIRTFKWFPKIPEIRDAAGYSQKAIDSALEMEAERQWLVVLEDVESSGWDCDNYLYGRDELKYPYENEATQYAVRQAGGIYGMLKRGESERHWAKKEFIDAFCRYTKTGALQATISDKEILQRLMANVNQKRLQ